MVTLKTLILGVPISLLAMLLSEMVNGRTLFFG